MSHYFVSGIGTDVGKTVVAAILVEALQADYWKPIQSGDLDNSDTMKVQNLISNNRTVFHSEKYRFKTPASPHLSAAIDGQNIDINSFEIPSTKNHLIVEGAGGLHVPLNDDFLLMDLIQKLGVEVVLVSQNYLGSINHTLLSIEALQSRNIPIKGIIFNGEKTESTESYILQYTGIQYLGNIEQENVVNKQMILKYAQQFKVEL